MCANKQSFCLCKKLGDEFWEFFLIRRHRKIISNKLACGRRKGWRFLEVRKYFYWLSNLVKSGRTTGWILLFPSLSQHTLSAHAKGQPLELCFPERVFHQTKNRKMRFWKTAKNCQIFSCSSTLKYNKYCAKNIIDFPQHTQIHTSPGKSLYDKIWHRF